MFVSYLCAVHTPSMDRWSIQCERTRHLWISSCSGSVVREWFDARLRWACRTRCQLQAVICMLSGLWPGSWLASAALLRLHSRCLHPTLFSQISRSMHTAWHCCIAVCFDDSPSTLALFGDKERKGDTREGADVAPLRMISTGRSPSSTVLQQPFRRNASQGSTGIGSAAIALRCTEAAVFDWLAILCSIFPVQRSCKTKRVGAANNCI